MEMREYEDTRCGRRSARSEADEYSDRFIRLCEPVERFIVRSIVTLAVLLVLSQLLLAAGGIRHAVSPTDRAEGVPLSE
ncbi:hypothetical protein [Paenibacillus thermotolerans]|uniref:hypothetical protein n=1 Tax=Paenibacillus thermotolerans TaxID=3027807 RepID=UPI0023686564|nr:MULTISPECIES: hypothetical protein [unclassified Paenibacillus]